MEQHIEPWAATFIQCIMKQVGVTHHQHLSIICQWEYTLIVDAIKKQLPSRNKVSLALNGWISMNKLAIMSVIAHYMDRNWALQEVQLAFDKVDSPFFSYFETSLRITGQGSTYGSTASRTFEGSSDHFELTDGRLLEITTNNASSKYLMSRELQTTLEASGIEWPTLRTTYPAWRMSFSLLWVHSWALWV